MDNAGYNTGSFDGLHQVSDDVDDDDEMVDIAGATLDFSNTDDDPPLNSGEGLPGAGPGSAHVLDERSVNQTGYVYSRHIVVQRVRFYSK